MDNHNPANEPAINPDNTTPEQRDEVVSEHPENFPDPDNTTPEQRGEVVGEYGEAIYNAAKFLEDHGHAVVRKTHYDSLFAQGHPGNRAPRAGAHPALPILEELRQIGDTMTGTSSVSVRRLIERIKSTL